MTSWANTLNEDCRTDFRRRPDRDSGGSRAPEPAGLVRFLTDAPRWLLLAGLVFAPWAYGSTRVWAVMSLSLGLIAAQGLWMAGCLVRRHRPRLPWPAVAAVGWLLGQGWAMTFNAKAAYQPNLEVLLPIPSWIEWAPGSVEGTFSLYAMIRFTALAGVFLFVCDLVRRPVWRRRLFLTMIWTGVSIALCGLLFKLGGTEALTWIWPREKINPANNFGMFRYRGNAGAFLNLILPGLILRTWLSFRQPDKPWTKALWVGALFLVVAGIQFNPSRASWAVAMGLALATLLFLGWHHQKHSDGLSGWPIRTVVAGGFTALTVAVALGAIAMWGGWETSWNRLGQMGLDLSRRSPVQVYRTMVPDAGWTGFGPGTFETIFPSYQATHDYATAAERQRWTTGYWRHAHQDYYQTVLEWGYLGALVLGFLLVGGLARAVRHLGARPPHASVSRSRQTEWVGNIDNRLSGYAMPWVLVHSMLALAGVLAHALVDFPLQIASIQLYAAVFLGTCWSPAFSSPSGPGSKRMPPERPIQSPRM